MTSVRFGPVGLDLTQIVRDAVDALGHFRADCVGQLVNLFEREWPNGISSTMLIYGKSVGEDLNADAKIAAGIDKRRMPRAVWDLLSDGGRLEPKAAIEATTVMVILEVQRRRRISQRPTDA